jgi:hypothetical protein
MVNWRADLSSTDDGHVVENGSPDELLKIPGGMFRRLLHGEELAAETGVDGV